MQPEISSVLRGLPPIQGQEQGVFLDEDFTSESYGFQHLVSQHYDSESSELPSFSELGQIQVIAKRKVQALKHVIQDIQIQIKQRQELETEILNNLGGQVSSVHNDKFKMEAFFQQNIPRPQGMEAGLMSQEHILLSKMHDVKQQSFRDVAELKKELRQRYLELVEAENLLMLGLEEMF